MFHIGWRSLTFGSTLVASTLGYVILSSVSLSPPLSLLFLSPSSHGETMADYPLEWS